MSLGDRPGETIRVTVSAVNDTALILRFEKPEDSEYFKERIGVTLLAQFHPIAGSDSAGDAPKQGGS